MRRRTLAVFVVLGGLLIGAAPASASSVTSVTVNNASPSNGAGARTQYVVGFKTTAALTNVGTIDVSFPGGTTFANVGSGNVFVGSTRVGSCQPPSSTTRCTLFAAIGASTTARLE